MKTIKCCVNERGCHLPPLLWTNFQLISIFLVPALCSHCYIKLCQGNVRNKSVGRVHSPKEGQGEMSQVIQFLLWSGFSGPPVAGLGPGSNRQGTAENGQGFSCYRSQFSEVKLRVNQLKRGVFHFGETMYRQLVSPRPRAHVEQLLPAGKSFHAPSSFSGISADSRPIRAGIWEKQKPWAPAGTIPGRCLALKANALDFSMKISFPWEVKSTESVLGKELKLKKLLAWLFISQKKVLQTPPPHFKESKTSIVLSLYE